MYYTIIAASGHQGAGFQIIQTFTSLKEAEEYKKNLETTDPNSPYFNVFIRRHRKPLHKLIIDEAHVRFADGTRAAL